MKIKVTEDMEESQDTMRYKDPQGILSEAYTPSELGIPQKKNNLEESKRACYSPQPRVSSANSKVRSNGAKKMEESMVKPKILPSANLDGVD